MFGMEKTRARGERAVAAQAVGEDLAHEREALAVDACVESQPIQDTVQLECSGTNFQGRSLQSSRTRGVRTNGPRIVGNGFDLTAVEIFEEFLGYPKTSGGIPHRSMPLDVQRTGAPRGTCLAIFRRYRRLC